MTEENKQQEEVKQAIARVGYDRIVVDVCPYCGKTHYHNFVRSGDDSNQRMADCFKGEYILVYQSGEENDK